MRHWHSARFGANSYLICRGMSAMDGVGVRVRSDKTRELFRVSHSSADTLEDISIAFASMNGMPICLK